MLKRLQHRRGNSQVISSEVGLQGELSVNIDNYSLVVFDGVTPGGHSVATANVVASIAANVSTIQSDIVTANIALAGLTANAGIQSSAITTLGTDISNANVAMKGYVDSQVSILTANAGAQFDSITSLTANAGAQSSAITTLGTDISNANVAMKGYVDSEITNVNTAVYSTTKTSPDINGIFTVVQQRRADNTLFLNSVLSGGTSPEYTTRTETLYALNGTTVLKTTVYTLTYSNGYLISEIIV